MLYNIDKRLKGDMQMEKSLRAAGKFSLSGNIQSCERYGSGHINLTFLIITDTGKRYILQKINSVVFPDVPGLMRNISSVTKYLSERVSEPRECLHLVPTLDGREYLRDEDGEYWRVYDYVEDSLCLQAPESDADFYESASAFGNFQSQLSDFPAHTLCETVKNFHNTPIRFQNFRRALEADAVGRAKECEYEIGEYLRREEDGAALQTMLKNGEVPLRVTHNDTKLNNVMLDAQTRKALCVIDLDTVMPGLRAYDFGDSIRFGAATAAEDEKDLCRMDIDLGLYRIFTRGFIRACPDITEGELKSLPYGAKLMTLECGVRFLTDYLEGDRYFAVHREGHNLDRCRTQLRLVQQMERKWDEMNRIVLEEYEAAQKN